MKEEGSLGDVTCSCDLATVEGLRKLERACAEEILEEANAALEKIHKQYKSDILGLGNQIRLHHPRLWNTLDWDEKFPGLRVKVSAEVSIPRVGMALRPP